MNLTQDRFTKGKRSSFPLAAMYFKDAVLQPGQTIYLDLDCSFDSQIANRYKAFDIQLIALHEELPAGCLPVQRTDSYVYRRWSTGN